MQSKLSAAIFGDREDPRRRLAALFGGDVPASGQPPTPAIDWARNALRRSDGRDVEGETAAIRHLRQAEPRLTLRAAAFLAAHVVRSR